MRRKAGALVPLEAAIITAGLRLEREGTREFHGFAIAKRLVSGGDARALTSHGTLYKALDRLETAGFLESTWEDPALAMADGRPRRRLYRVTAAGAVALTNSVADVPTHPSTGRRLASP